MRRALVITVLLVLVACSGATENSLVYVKVKAAIGMPPVTQLRVSLSNGGSTDSELFPPTNTGSPIAFDTSFALSLSKSRKGDLEIAVEALDARGGTVATGRTTVPIVVGGRTDASVTLSLFAFGDAGVRDALAADLRADGLDGASVGQTGADANATLDGLFGGSLDGLSPFDAGLPDSPLGSPDAEGPTSEDAPQSGGGLDVKASLDSAKDTILADAAVSIAEVGSTPADAPVSGTEPDGAADRPPEASPETASDTNAVPRAEAGVEGGSQPDVAPVFDAIPDGSPDTEVVFDSAVTDANLSAAGWVDRTPSVLPASWPIVRSELALAYDASRDIVVMFAGWRGGTNYRLSETWEWNGAAGTWANRTPASLPSAWPLDMTGPAMAYDGHGRIFMFGGFASGVAWLDGAWEWNGTAGTWTNRTPTTLPSAWPAKRAWFNMAYDSNRDVVFVFGGSTPSGLARDVWEWNAVNHTWTNRTPTTLPTAWPVGRNAYGMAYDSTRRRVVVFGGNTDAGLANDTWEWNGDTGIWTTRTPVVLPASWPAARTGHAMAFDPQRGKVIMFGGDQGRSGGLLMALQDTWEWDGDAGTWTNVTPDPLPAVWPEARSQLAMVYDVASYGIMMFGGGDYVAIRFPSPKTWEWMNSSSP